MLVQRRGERGSFANRVRNLQHHGAQGWILLLLTQTVQGLRDGNRRAEQRAHLASERGNILSADTLPKMLLFPSRVVHGGRGSRSTAIARGDFKHGREQSAPAQQQQRGFTILRLDHPLHRNAARLDCLVAKRGHSSKSPDDTRRISSIEVTPVAAFSKASWCMVIIVRCAAALSRALDCFWRIISRNSVSMGSSSKMPIRPR